MSRRAPYDPLLAVADQLDRSGRSDVGSLDDELPLRVRRSTAFENTLRFRSRCCGAETVLGTAKQWWCTACFADSAPPPAAGAVLDEARAIINRAVVDLKRPLRVGEMADLLLDNLPVLRGSAEAKELLALIGEAA